jgi:hypothetical protein
MLTFGVLAVLGLAGYSGWPWWMVVPGVGFLTLQSWWVHLLRLGEPDHGSWSKKITAYFVTGILADLVMTATAFSVGRILRWALS